MGIPTVQEPLVPCLARSEEEGDAPGVVVSLAGCSWRRQRDLKFIQGKFLRGRKSIS